MKLKQGAHSGALFILASFCYNPLMSQRPIDIRKVGDSELLVLWPDSHRSLYSFKYLRFNCSCAQCVDEWTGRRQLTLDRIPGDIHPLDTASVGSYGIRFRWSDGHETGIYGFDHLRKICPCEACSCEREAAGHAHG